MLSMPLELASENVAPVAHILATDKETRLLVESVFRSEGIATVPQHSAAALLAGLSRHLPSLVVLDPGADKSSGLALIAAIKQSCDGAAVLVVAGDTSVAFAVAAMKAGASDVICKPFDGDCLALSIREALAHQAGAGFADRAPQATSIPGFAQLTPREREVLRLIARGRSNKEAGRYLGISPRTVEVHRARVMDKLGARNTAELMRIVLSEHGISRG